ALMVAIDRAHHARPRIKDTEVAGRLAFEQSAFAVDDPGLDAEEGPRRRAGLERRGARKGGDQDAAGLAPPPSVADRAAALADDAVVPQPGFGVDRLADRAEQPQRLAAGALHRLLALAHEGADRRRRGVDDIDLVLVHHLPEARG